MKKASHKVRARVREWPWGRNFFYTSFDLVWGGDIVRKRDLPCMLLSRAVEVFEYRAIRMGLLYGRISWGWWGWLRDLVDGWDLSLNSGMPMNALTKLLSSSANSKGSCLVSFRVEGGVQMGAERRTQLVLELYNLWSLRYSKIRPVTIQTHNASTILFALRPTG